MKNHKASLSKVKLLILVTSIGITAISATGSTIANNKSTTNITHCDTMHSSEPDPLPKVLIKDDLLAYNENGDYNPDFAGIWEEDFLDVEENDLECCEEDWEAVFEAILASDEEEETQEIGTAVWVKNISLDKKLLPLNEYVYSRHRNNSDWTSNVVSSASIARISPDKPAVENASGQNTNKRNESIESGGGSATARALPAQRDPNETSVWVKNSGKKSGPLPRKPAAIKVAKQKKSIESGEGSALTSDCAKVRIKDVIQFGIESETEYGSREETGIPFSTHDLNPESRKNIFLAWKTSALPEPSFYSFDDEIDPFDEAVQVVNDTVYDYRKSRKDDDLLAQADAPEPAEQQAQENADTENADEAEAEPAVNRVVPPPEQPEEEVVQEETGYLVRFTNVAMQEYLSFISEITGKNFIFDPADLDFRVTIVSNEPTSLENVMIVLLQELRIRGMDMVEVGNNIIIHRDTGINSPAHVVGEKEKIPDDVEIVTQVYRLANTEPDTMSAIIRPMLSPAAVIQSIPASGHLIVTGLKSNILRITDLINSVDSPEAGLEIGQYQAQNLPISQALSIAREMLAPIARDRTLVMVPVSNNNIVYIVTTPGLMVQVLSVLSKIDNDEELPRTPFDIDARGRPLVDETDFEARARAVRDRPLGTVDVTKFYIHKLQYRKGDQIQQALRAIAESLEDIQIEIEDYTFIATINSVQWIQSTNSLIFTGTTETLEKIKELIDELDTSLPQVLVEILVIEATVDDSLTFGVDWGTRFGSPTMAGGQAFLQENSPLSAALDTGVPGMNLDPAGLARQAGFNLGVIGRAISRGGCDFNTMGALVRALHTDRRIDVLLNPKIVVEDNATAEFFVGINTPFQTQSIANDLGTIITGNFEFRDVGSTIKITPLIGNNSIITLDIEQEISSAAQSNFVGGGTTQVTPGAGGVGAAGATGGGQTGLQESISATAATTNIGPTTRRSTTKTRVHMPDGYFLILSGQIRDEKEEIRTQVPCLGGVPWIGSLFSSKQNNITKNNLMIFIRPQIIDIERINPITKRQQDIWTERKRLPKRWEYEVDEALQWFNVKEPYCAPERRPLRE
jgi:type III secretion protein C